MSGRYKQPVQYGRNSAHKSRAAWAVFSLGVCMRERQHIYEDLNKCSSASPGGSQQSEILPSPNSKRAANFFQIRWYFTRRGDFNARQDSIVRLYFCQTPTFFKSPNILYICQYFESRQHFVHPPIFWKAPTFCKSANILEICRYFGSPPIFSKSAYFSVRRQQFPNPPISLRGANIFKFAWFLLLQIFCVYFQYLFCAF